jgi:hypothetical protein
LISSPSCSATFEVYVRVADNPRLISRDSSMQDAKRDHF